MKSAILVFLGSRRLILSGPLLLLNALALQAACAFALHESFDVREATIDSVHNALFTGLTSCRGVVSAFLSRIEELNPLINAVIGLNPDALAIADEMDQRMVAGNVTGKLFCIPVLLKENYDATPMNTTGGCMALAGKRPAKDASTVKALKRENAIILGKVNMHEMALEGLSVSTLGGQTFNPYDQTRTPGGSSGGTGAAIATSFAVFGTGTDTVNSLRSPASANNLVSVRPTRGLISRAGVIPVSYTQDTAGPIARNIKDLAIALTVMASIGFDEADNATALPPSELVGKDYSAELHGGHLKGLRFGALNGFRNYTASSETTPIINVMDDMIKFLKSEGAHVVDTTEDAIFTATEILAELDVQQYEYRELLDAYLAGSDSDGTAPTSFNDLYTKGKFIVIPSQYAYVKNAFVSSTGSESYALRQLGIKNLTNALLSMFSCHKLDALIYPEQKNLVVKIGSASQSGRNGILAALTGLPVVTVPAGFSPRSEDAPIGVPIGMEMMGLPFSEGKLLNIASHITHLHSTRRMPTFANRSVEVKEYSEVPVIRPNMGNIPAAYPIGVLS
ncbi:hypothetical protein DL764_008585 [Monosporascus ibericus]|uniref:Amidase domain-containing protein n=1 Tax=Monosporascus ibericus TaxID=155417 RepID=A0A4Q4T0J0_9PEZI|nr:hypothetical protein DL764_008585 [Monosporascus ibericus]